MVELKAMHLHEDENTVIKDVFPVGLWIEDLKFTVSDDQYNRVVNSISIGVKREFAQDRVQVSGFCQGVPNCS